MTAAGLVPGAALTAATATRSHYPRGALLTACAPRSARRASRWRRRIRKLPWSTQQPPHAPGLPRPSGSAAVLDAPPLCVVVRRPAAVTAVWVAPLPAAPPLARLVRAWLPCA